MTNSKKESESIVGTGLEFSGAEEPRNRSTMRFKDASLDRTIANAIFGPKLPPVTILF